MQYSDDFLQRNCRVEYPNRTIEPQYIDGKSTGLYRVSTSRYPTPPEQNWIRKKGKIALFTKEKLQELKEIMGWKLAPKPPRKPKPPKPRPEDELSPEEFTRLLDEAMVLP